MQGFCRSYNNIIIHSRFKIVKHGKIPVIYHCRTIYSTANVTSVFQDGRKLLSRESILTSDTVNALKSSGKCTQSRLKTISSGTHSDSKFRWPRRGVSYIDAREKRFRNTIPACMLPRKKFRNGVPARSVIEMSLTHSRKH
jgi:hypothetical protein